MINSSLSSIDGKSSIYRSVAERMKTHELKNYNGYSYNYLSTRANPFDLLLFRGGDSLSDTIRVASKINNGNGDFSHAGMVVTRDILPSIKQMRRGRLYIWEATMSYNLMGMTDGVPDIQTNQGKFGIQIRDLEEVLKSYVEDSDHKAMAWCKLELNPWLRQTNESTSDFNTRRKEIILKMAQLHYQISSRRFERSPLAVVGAFIPLIRPVRDITDEIFIGGIKAISWSGDKLNQLRLDKQSTGTIQDYIETIRQVMRRNKSLARKIEKCRKREISSSTSSLPSSSNTLSSSPTSSLPKLPSTEIRGRVIHYNSNNNESIELSNSSVLNRASCRYLFCSEMVAVIYIEMGILSANINPANILPTDFITNSNGIQLPILIFPSNN